MKGVCIAQDMNVTVPHPAAYCLIQTDSCQVVSWHHRFVEWPFLDVFGWGGVWRPVQDWPGLLCAALAWVEACCNNIVLSININYSWYITHNFPSKLACDCSEENGGWHFAILKSIKGLTFGVVSWGPWLDWIYETATCYVKLCWGLWKRSTLRPLHRTK